MAKIENKTEYARFCEMCLNFPMNGYGHCHIKGKTVYIGLTDINDWQGFTLYFNEGVYDTILGKRQLVADYRHYLFITNNEIYDMKLRTVYDYVVSSITNKLYEAIELVRY